MANNRILSNVEKDFMISALDLGLRIDGRNLRTVREMQISFGSKTGTVCVSLGKTRVLARITHELGSPRIDKPNEGIININCTFPKYYTDTIINNYDIDRICLIIKAGIYESKAIDLESLCILNGDKVWILNCNISIIQNDGNIIDCANLAILSALKHHRRPDVTVVGSKITVHSMIDRHPISLSIHHLPICVTLAHVLNENTDKNNDGFYTFTDPNFEEEKLMNGKTVYCMTSYNQLCAIDKIGGVPMNAKSFLNFINQFVIKVVKKWTNQIENKFIQYQYQQNNAAVRKNKLNKKIINPIDVFDIKSINEIKNDNNGINVNENDEKDNDDDLFMIDDNNNNNKIDIRSEWENKERNKLEMIQNNLKESLSEKRISANKSVLTSEFDSID
eukprot:331355_1